VSKLFTDVDVADAVIDQLITNNFLFFFLMSYEIEYIVHLVVVVSCHVMSCRLNIVTMCTKFFFFIHFFLILWSDCCYHHVVINFCSCSSSHYTCHHRSSSENFFLLSSLLLERVITKHLCCCEIVMVACVSITSLCVLMKLRIKKTPHGLL
jgi:hypothetical protein